MDENIKLKVQEDILKLEKASKLIGEVLDNLEGLDGQFAAVPLMLNSANVKVRNISNCLKLVLDPTSTVSVSIPIVFNPLMTRRGEWDEKEIIANSGVI